MEIATKLVFGLIALIILVIAAGEMTHTVYEAEQTAKMGNNNCSEATGITFNISSKNCVNATGYYASEADISYMNLQDTLFDGEGILGILTTVGIFVAVIIGGIALFKSRQ